MRIRYVLITILSLIVTAGSCQWMSYGAMAAAMLCCLALVPVYEIHVAYRSYKESYLLGLDMWEDRCFYVLAERRKGEMRILACGCWQHPEEELTELMRSYENLQVRIAVNARRMLFRQLEVPARPPQEMERMLSYELDYRFPWHSPDWLSSFGYLKVQRPRSQMLQQVTLSLWHRNEYRRIMTQLPPDGFTLLSLEPRSQALYRVFQAQQGDSESISLLIEAVIGREGEAALSLFREGVMVERILLCEEDYLGVIDELQRLYHFGAVSLVCISTQASRFVQAVRDALCTKNVITESCRWIEAGSVLNQYRICHSSLNEDCLAALGVLLEEGERANQFRC